MGPNVDALYLCRLRYLNSTSANVSNDLIRKIQLHEKRMELDPLFVPTEIFLCSLSIIVSSLNTFILKRKSMLQSSLNCLLVALELSNIVFALCLLQRASIVSFFGHEFRTKEVLVLDQVAKVALRSAAYMINWLTVVIGAWRLIAVTWPFQAPSLLNRGRALLIIVALPFLCSAYAIGYPFVYEIKERTFFICSDLSDTRKKEVQGFYRELKYFKTHKRLFSKRLRLAINILYYLIPCLCFLVVTAGLVWTIYKHRKVRKTLCEGNVGAVTEKCQTRATVILTVMLSCFLVGNCFPLAFNLFEVTRNDISSTAQLLQNSFNYFSFSLLTNSFSFVAYYFMGTNFRDSVRAILTKHGFSKKSISTKPSLTSVQEISL